MFVADSGLKEIQTHGVNFGVVNQPLTLYFTFTSGGSGVSASVLTQGAQGLDFSDQYSGTCDTYGTSHTYSAGDTCTMNVEFMPQYAGARYGAVVLSDAGGPIATAYLYGTGQGPELVFGPDTQISLGTGAFKGPFGVAIDGSGNVYIADSGHNLVKEVPFGCTSSSCVTACCVTTLGNLFSVPFSVAVDGAGNVYVADASAAGVHEMTPGCTSSSCVTALGGGFSVPSGMAVDGSGNVYIADAGNDSAEEMPPGCTAAAYASGSYRSPRWAAASTIPAAWRWTEAATSTSPTHLTVR